jgi:hypothetical protein
MAFAALHGCMFPFQVIPGEAVVKIFCVKPYHFKVPSVVLAMTLKTILAFYSRACMITLVLIYALTDFGVTIHAQLIRYTLAQIMAFRAVAHPLQCRMGCRKVARRYLAPGFRQSQHQHEAQSYEEPNHKILIVLFHDVSKPFFDLNAGLLQELVRKLAACKDVYQIVFQFAAFTFLADGYCLLLNGLHIGVEKHSDALIVDSSKYTLLVFRFNSGELVASVR